MVNLGLKIKIDMSRVVEELVRVQQPIRDQLLESKHMLTLGQLFQIALDLKQYVFFELFIEQKSVPPLPPILTMALVAIDPHMTII